MAGGHDADDLRRDVAALLAMIDRLLDEGAPSDSPVLSAAARVLADRQRELAALDAGDGVNQR